jgi:hypothetical protein
MTVVAEAERVVDIARDRAFELFIDFPRWHDWMPQDFRPVDGPSRPLEEGDVLRVRIPPVTATIQVLRVRPHDEVCWGGGVPGLRAEHSFYFDELGPEQTRIRSVEPWKGALTRVPPLAHKLMNEASRVGAAQLEAFAQLVARL